MRYIAMIIIGVLILLGLYLLVETINAKVLDESLDKWVRGYWVGWFGFMINNLLLKWYKKEL